MARKFDSHFMQSWNKHVLLYSGIFQRALAELNVDIAQKEHEDAISEKLNIYLEKQCRKHKDKPPTPCWEAPIKPNTENDLKGGNKGKRPDFTCSLVNPNAKPSEEYEVSLHIECKRLGGSSGSYNLTKNYVTKGIARFDDEHEYGKYVEDGFLVGYIVSWEPIEIKNKVNEHIKVNNIGCDSLVFEFPRKVVSCTVQYNRSNVLPPDFRLTHIWVDLRKLAIDRHLRAVEL